MDLLVGQLTEIYSMAPSPSPLWLDAMTSIETVSTICNTTSWVWGGFGVDINYGRILREHDDLDFLTLNLGLLIPEFTGGFTRRGWQVQHLDNGDLKLRKEGIKAQLGNVEVTAKAKWTHDGDKGYICFPIDWLHLRPVQFCDRELHVVGPELLYVLKENPELLNSKWIRRDKDIADLAYLRELLREKRYDVETLASCVTSVRIA